MTHPLGWVYISISAPTINGGPPDYDNAENSSLGIMKCLDLRNGKVLDSLIRTFDTLIISDHPFEQYLRELRDTTGMGVDSSNHDN